MRLNEIKSKVTVPDFTLTEYHDENSDLSQLLKANPKAVVDVDDNILLDRGDFPKLPVKFGVVGGNCQVSNCGLTTLENAPTEIFLNFQVHNNKLTSLKYGPTKVGGTYAVYQNNIATFEGIPKVLERLAIQDNKITSLVGIHKYIEECHLINMNRNPVVEGGLGLILIKGLIPGRLKFNDMSGVDMSFKDSGDLLHAMAIIDEYLGQGKAGILECQQELIDAGLERFAKL